MDIEIIWNGIKLHEGETFHTITGKEYKYVVYPNFLLINNIKSRKITKDINEPNTSGIAKNNSIVALYIG